MPDQSHLDQKYFLDGDKYNCPFCNRRSISYRVVDNFLFRWDESEDRYGYIVQCGGCQLRSLHLSQYYWSCGNNQNPFESEPSDFGDNEGQIYDPAELDKFFFYHHPTSFFTIDHRIPKVVRELVAEADGCRKMNFLVGASGALRKAIYKFLKDQQAVGVDYEDKIKWLKNKHQSIAGEYFDALSNIQGMTSEELHEEKDWEPWKSEEFDFLIATVKGVLHEVYVVPANRKEMLQKVLDLGPNKKTANKKEVAEASEQTVNKK